MEYNYLVCVADNRTQPRKIPAAFLIRTNRHHNDASFQDALAVAFRGMEHLRHLQHDQISFLPAQIGTADKEPITEKEFLSIAFQQYTKFSVSGHA